jgi:hypothetical protein
MTLSGFSTFNLLYRATRDGFDAHTFHRLCDNRLGTLTIYRNNLNSVFGGYTAQQWNHIGSYRTDATAYLVSLRRRGVSNSERFNVASSSWAIYCHSNSFPTFGSGYDLHVRDQPDIFFGSYTNYCSSYSCPASFVTANQYLAGLYDNWLVTEIEVYFVS